jgi:KDO2-lipid IV(A) lauroyltransferase
VTLFDAPGTIPEGPLRLAAVAGAPVLPVFCARTGYRRYLIDVRPPIVLSRRPTDAELDAAAQALASEMTRFLRAHPTQWFHFGRAERNLGNMAAGTGGAGLDESARASGPGLGDPP